MELLSVMFIIILLNEHDDLLDLLIKYTLIQNVLIEPSKIYVILLRKFTLHSGAGVFF